LFIGPLTYVLGAAAGFFAFVGISLIARGYQIENGTSLKIFL
jgi:hypothetical protein